jgi:hypothetical protein
VALLTGEDIFPAPTVLRSIHFSIELVPFGLIFQELSAMHQSEVMFSMAAKSEAAATDLSASVIPLGLDQIFLAMHPANFLTSALM